MARIAPCYQCKDRRLGCHGECERYAEFDERRKAQLKAKNERLEFECDSRKFKSDAIARVKHGRFR